MLYYGLLEQQSHVMIENVRQRKLRNTKYLYLVSKIQSIFSISSELREKISVSYSVGMRINNRCIRIPSIMPEAMVIMVRMA